eukprot:4057274-Amphidinium_carterae.1
MMKVSSNLHCSKHKCMRTARAKCVRVELWMLPRMWSYHATAITSELERAPTDTSTGASASDAATSSAEMIQC